jgi:hypothetical protein
MLTYEACQMVDPSSFHLDYVLVFLAVVGAFHTLISLLKLVRFLAVELRDELHEWRKFFRGG